ncbi:hypothetical protein [endosymbiont GvMRE of Glomus versiforme]|uniref:hypothetical protein n=1 Tax=endosymbiont GvMRE of Glomus versiforme TaxID=2039283 RepID=UPI000ECD6875|nr:hypothetical protein [endosymbiont GvMRE of Glomus versiforme]RHZ37565.1 hypothetical protein GvMRE_I1g364 [endosymbiont GvMRE of Glomus versiforme]
MAEEEEKGTTSKPSKAGNPSQSVSAKIIPQQIQAKQQKLAQFKQELSQNQPNSSQAQTIQESISQLEAELTKEELEYKLQQTEQQITENQQEILEQEWEEIQEIQEEVLEEAPAPELPPVAKLMEEAAQAAEAAADSSSESSAAQQNQMTLFMLYLIIFLLEYIVYKRNGLPGLVILNICLAIAYYKKDQILEYQHLWENYFLIIGYVMGNVLAYSAPEQEKYKMPSVIGFNAIIALLYTYTWYQKRQINQASQKELTKIQEETIQKIQAQNQNYETESKKVEQEYTQKQQTIIEKIEQQQKPKQEQRKLEAELEQTLKEAQETENTHQKEQAQEKINQIKQSLAEIKKNPLTSAVDIDLLEAKEPGIKSEWERIKGWLKSIIPRNQETNTLQKLSSVIESLPLTEEEANILSNLHLTQEQVFAISCQAERAKYHTNELKENYHQLTNFQKLKLLNSGLEALGLKTLESKYTLARIQQQIAQEQQNFNLTTKEKENILRLLITTLNLTENQRNFLEEMGVSFFNAANWRVSEEQKDNLLKFGLERVKLTEEQEEKLATLHPDAFKTFAFSEKQKTILQSLAPLTKEYKYSQQALELVRYLSLKSSSLSFFVNQEIIPDPNTAFGETKSPYLPLKTKFLQGEQKILKKQQEEKEKQANQEQIQADKLSIITSLLKWYKETDETQFNLTLDNYVEIGTLKGWQRDILLTCGLKTIPKYNFFELLVFAVETFTEQTFAESLEENNWLEEYYQEYLNSLANQEISINKIIWEKYASSRTPKEREILANLNLEEIINEQINRHLNTYQPVKDKDWEKWKDISLDFTTKLVKEWKNNSFSYETAKEWIDIGLKPEESNYAKWLRDIIELTPEQVLNESDSEELRKKYQEWQQENQPSKPTSSTSRYDDLFANLNQEEAEHQKKKKSREETRKKLDEQEFSRRQANLFEKDRKLKGEEERYQREKELETQETEKKRQLREARDKELAEQEEKRLAARTEQIERNRKLAAEALKTKQKEIELEEQKKREQIERLEKANKLEQERLKKKAKLLEEETKKRLEAIALEDQEARQKIEKEMEQRKAYLEEEMLEQKRKHERELKVKEQELERKKKEQQADLEKMRQEAELMERQEQQAKQQQEQMRTIARRQEEIDQRRRQNMMSLELIHEQALDYVLGYFPFKDEFNNSVQGVSWTHNTYANELYSVRDWFSRGARIDISKFYGVEHGSKQRLQKNSSNQWIYWAGRQLSRVISYVGSGFLSKEQLRQRIKEKIKDPDIFR